MSQPINRITLFKIPNAKDQETLINIYKDMPRIAVKVCPVIWQD